MRFEFATATRIVFGHGAFADAGGLLRPLGRHAFVVTGRSGGRADRLAGLLRAEGLAATVFHVAAEPDLALIEQGTSTLHEAGCDFVVGLGGGSAIDAAKAIAALAGNGGELLDYLEVIGRGRSLERPSLPCVAMPTTAGTGSEVTRNAVLASPADRVKVSMRSPFMLPRLALVDPELTLDLPPRLTASTGLDALTQLIEPYLSVRANPLTDAICTDGIRRAASALRSAFDDGGSRDAREQMALASLFGGLALANAGLGAVHGFAGPLGGMFDAPHGALCAALLPHVMSGNLRALRGRAPGHPALRRFDEVARLATGQPAATAETGVEWLHDLVGALEIPRLGAYGVAPQDVDAVVERAAQASSMKGNPIVLQPAELREMLLAAL